MLTLYHIGETQVINNLKTKIQNEGKDVNLMLHFYRCTYPHSSTAYTTFVSTETEQEKQSSSWWKSTEFKAAIYQYICQNVTVDEQPVPEISHVLAFQVL